MAHPAPRRGYIDDAVYPVTCLRELSPAWLGYAATINGARSVPVTGPFRYLELGCGRALSAIVHAAAFPAAEFHACDADGDCIDAARRLAAELELGNLTLHRASFAEFAHQDPGSFEFIVAHGVYSWVDDDARRVLRALMGAWLAPAGVAYLSYNCMPGWATEAPLRRMMVELAASAGGDGAARARAAAGLLRRLGAGSVYFRVHPEAPAAVDGYLRSPPGYLAHEFLNDVFEAFYSVDVVDEMAESGLTLLGSATLADNHPALLMAPPSVDTIAALPTARQRQLATDFTVHRRFRRDLYVRTESMPAAGTTALQTLIVGCPGDPARLAAEIRVPRGRIRFADDFIRALRRLMTKGSAPMGELIEALARTGAHRTRDGADRAGIARNLAYLIAAGELTPFARASAEPLPEVGARVSFGASAAMLERVAASGDRGWIPSSILGGGVAVDAHEAVAVLDHVRGAARREARQADLLARLTRLGILI